jgi:predicted permease
MIHYLRVLAARLRGLFGERGADRDLDDEIEAHLRLLTERYVRQGMSEDEATRTARRQFGNATLLKEAHRDMRGIRFIDTLVQDVRYGLRALGKNPGFTFVAALTLALGIGANTAIFSVVNAVLLRALPVKDPQRLVFLSNPNRHGINSEETGDRRLFAYHEFEWLRDHNLVFSGMFAAHSATPTLPVAVEGSAQSGGTERVSVSLVSGAYFSVLGVKAALGRTFTAEVDKISGADPVAVISYGYWKNRFALAPSVIGRKLRISQTTFDITGVAPPEFSGETVGRSPDVWVPLTMQTVELYSGKGALAPPQNVKNKYMSLQVMARLRDGVTIEQAQASVNVTLRKLLRSEAGHLAADERAGYLNQRIALVNGSRGASTLRTRFGEPLLILMGLVGLVLLIACANVANLLLARASTRGPEMAVRVALGAGRGRLIRQLLTESALLALLGGVFGLLLAQWADALLLQLVSSGSAPIPLDLHPDAHALGFTLGVSTLTGILFGLAPALRAARVDVHAALKGGARGSAGGGANRGRLVAGKILVVGQVALSLFSLIIGGLFARSFQKLTQIELGYDGAQILQFNLSPNPATANHLHKELLDRLRAIPGVRGASLSLSGLFNGVSLDMDVSVEGQQGSPGLRMMAICDYVGPGYFSTVGVPILAGREIGPQDEGDAPLVGMINRTMADAYFGGTNPIGRRIRASAAYGTLDFEIVGVVADSKRDDLREASESCFYVPYFHAARHPNFSWAVNEARIAGNAGAVAAAIRAAVKETAPSMDAPEIRFVNDLVGQSITTERVIAQLSSLFGLLALLLACVGLYGVMSYSVAGRTNEIGVRLALGARPRDVFKLIARQGMTLVLIGVMAGLSAAFALTRLIAALLYGLSAIDPATFVVVTVLLMGVALLACWIPARRATKVDPLQALRRE